MYDLLLLVYVPVELDVDGNVVSWELPWIKVQPVVWNLDLITIDYFLLEDAVLVSKSVAPCWVIHCGHAVEEAGCETSKTSIAKGGVVFL